MQVVLPDGTSKELPDGASGADLAASIGAGLAAAGLPVPPTDSQVDWENW